VLRLARHQPVGQQLGAVLGRLLCGHDAFAHRHLDRGQAGRHVGHRGQAERDAPHRGELVRPLARVAAGLPQRGPVARLLQVRRGFVGRRRRHGRSCARFAGGLFGWLLGRELCPNRCALGRTREGRVRACKGGFARGGVIRGTGTGAPAKATGAAGDVAAGGGGSNGGGMRVCVLVVCLRAAVRRGKVLPPAAADLRRRRSLKPQRGCAHPRARATSHRRALSSDRGRLMIANSPNGTPSENKGAKTTANAVAAGLPTANIPPLAKYKLVFLGDQSVGKTAIVQRFIFSTFDSSYQATIGVRCGAARARGERADARGCLAGRLISSAGRWCSKTARCGCSSGTRRARSASGRSSLRTLETRAWRWWCTT
jgi:hypothetical protein